jgi:Fe-S cluster assembly ATPase SufC
MTSLAAIPTGRIAFNKAEIMRYADHEARFALGLSRARREPVATRRAIFGRFLAKAWAAAKAEAASLARQAEQAVAVRIMLAERARQSVALVASYGGAEGVRQAIASETMRDRMDFAVVVKLKAALTSVGA